MVFIAHFNCNLMKSIGVLWAGQYIRNTEMVVLQTTTIFIQVNPLEISDSETRKVYFERNQKKQRMLIRASEQTKPPQQKVHSFVFNPCP